MHKIEYSIFAQQIIGGGGGVKSVNKAIKDNYFLINIAQENYFLRI